MIKGLPERLRSLRIKFGYSQKQVADKLNMSPSIVSGYETGERTPSAEILLSLSYLFNCSVDYLLGRQAVPKNFVIDVSGLSDSQIKALNDLVDAIKDNL